jgi:hypothetical protein
MATLAPFPKLYHRFVRSRSGSGSNRRVRSGQRCRVTLESLEDRCVPSTFTVTTLDDIGNGSLRQAIDVANNTPGDDTIDFAPGLTGTIDFLHGAGPAVYSNIDLEGPGSAVLTVSRYLISVQPGVVFTVSGLTLANYNSLQENNATVTISNCTLTGGNTVGGISTDGGTVTVNNCTIANNSAGPGITSNGTTLTISNCTIANNTGGINNFGGGTMNIDSSTINANSIQGDGGGIVNSGTLILRNSTVTANRAQGTEYFQMPTHTFVHVPGKGGGITNSGTLTICSSTIAGNSADIGGGVQTSSPGAVTVHDTIIAQNQAPTGPDVSGAFNSLGHNLVGDGTASSGFTAAGDQVGTSATPIDPKLGPLQNNGGSTATMALLPGSPAIAAGDSTNAPTIDQRGFTRQPNPSYDIGAFAYNVGSPTQRFVAAVYQDLLHRPADLGGLVGWSQQLDSLVAQGVPLPQAQSHIVWCIENDGGHEYFTNVVVSCYQQYLGRLPGASDKAFVASEVNFLAATVPAYPQQVAWPYAQVRLSFLTSSEYAQWHGGSDNAAFVEGLYQDCLGRSAAGDVGAANYVQLLNAGAMTQTQVAQAVLLSTEYESDQVAGWYEQFLGRPPSTAGDLANVQYYAQALQAGVPEAGLIAAMLGSPGQEYFNKAQT